MEIQNQRRGKTLFWQLALTKFKVDNIDCTIKKICCSRIIQRYVIAALYFYALKTNCSHL